MQIDFIADHDLQVQAAESIFEELSRYFDCRWRIGTNLKPSGAEVAIMVGHPGDHPLIKKTGVSMVKNKRSIPTVWHPLESVCSPIDSFKALWRGYKYLFFLSHDLGDIEIYKFEQRRLKTYDIIFAPNVLHYTHAKEHLGRKAIVIQTGWAKYDKMQFGDKYKELEQNIKRLPYRFTILYAPSFAWTYEWKYLLPLLKSLPCNVILKNHIYINKGQPLPKGLESEYRQHLESAEEMENFMAEGSPTNAIVAPRELNICSLFPYVNLLISDQSSALLEFAPFATCIETGHYIPNQKDIEPVLSRISDDILFLDKTKICEVFSSMENLRTFMRQTKPKTGFTANKISTGEMTSFLIRKYLEEWRNPSSTSCLDKKNIEDQMVVWKDEFIRVKTNKENFCYSHS